MAILSPISEVFDVFVAEMKASSREDAARSLERADGEIYLRIDRKRFRLIRKDERTVLTTLGAETFGDPILANAILDRLLHYSRVFKIVGRSYRTKDILDFSMPAAEPLGVQDQGEDKTKKKGGRQTI